MEKPDGLQKTINTAHSHGMPDTYGHKQTLRIYNSKCFSTATMVTRKSLNVTSYVR